MLDKSTITQIIPDSYPGKKKLQQIHKQLSLAFYSH